MTGKETKELAPCRLIPYSRSGMNRLYRRHSRVHSPHSMGLVSNALPDTRASQNALLVPESLERYELAAAAAVHKARGLACVLTRWSAPTGAFCFALLNLHFTAGTSLPHHFGRPLLYTSSRPPTGAGLASCLFLLRLISPLHSRSVILSFERVSRGTSQKYLILQNSSPSLSSLISIATCGWTCGWTCDRTV